MRVANITVLLYVVKEATLVEVTGPKSPIIAGAPFNHCDSSVLASSPDKGVHKLVVVGS